MYRLVAQKLSEIARSSQDEPFGRSVFNRSYYSLFLTARSLIFLIDTDRTEIEHASLPKYLRVGISNRVKKEFEKQYKANLFSSKSLESSLLSDLDELARLLEEGKRLRTIADYEPNQKVSFVNGTVVLGMKKDSEAISWPTKAEILCRKIEDGLRQISIIQNI